MKLRLLVAALALFTSVAVANASLVRDDAWFSLEASSDPNVTVLGGGPGQTLVIEKPLGTGVTHLTIGYNFTNNFQFGFPDGMYRWGFTLDGIDPMGGTQSVTAGNGDFTLSQAAFYDQDIPNIDPGAALFSAGARSNALNGLAGLVFTFDIWIEKFDSTPTTTDIFGDLDKQITSAGFYWFGSFGPNPGRYGYPNYNDRLGELPVITIINPVPEPVTLSLLALGGLALLRRRRR